jgi:hypothetical protein
MTKYLLFGLGSIGRRHADNLRALRPACHIIAADPFCAQPEPGGPITMFYRDWRRALADHPDSAAAIIASPTAAHFEQLAECWAYRIRGVYAEKPLCLPSEIGDCETLVRAVTGARWVSGFQYKFAQAMPRLRQAAEHHGEVTFYARDNLLNRYGHTVGDAMACHPLATACWIFGEPISVHLATDGIGFSGYLVHTGGRVSRFDIRMDAESRSSFGFAGRSRVDLPGGDVNFMYRQCMRSWLDWLDGKPRDPRLSSLADGLSVSRVLSQVSYVQTAQAQTATAL